MPQLICEGACNPDAGLLDADLKRYRSREGLIGSGAVLPPSDELVTRLRRLAYTDHVETEREFFYVCTVCGFVRRYGNEKAGPYSREAIPA